MAQSFYPTAEDLIEAAMGAIRSVDPEDTAAPTATQLANALRSLNYIVTSWQAHGMQVWCTKNASLTMVAGTASYTVGPSGSLNIQRPLSVTQAWLHNTSEDTDPLQLMPLGREEYNNMSDKESESTPNSFWYNPEYDLPATNSGANAKGKLYLYPAPSTSAASTYTVTIVYTRPIQDFATAADSLDFPQEWYNAVKWNLAADIAFDYGVPIQYLDRIKAKADEELIAVKGWDREEGSMYITPVNSSNAR